MKLNEYKILKHVKEDKNDAKLDFIITANYGMQDYNIKTLQEVKVFEEKNVLQVIAHFTEELKKLKERTDILEKQTEGLELENAKLKTIVEKVIKEKLKL